MRRPAKLALGLIVLLALQAGGAVAAQPAAAGCCPPAAAAQPGELPRPCQSLVPLACCAEGTGASLPKPALQLTACPPSPGFATASPAPRLAAPPALLAPRCDARALRSTVLRL